MRRTSHIAAALLVAAAAAAVAVPTAPASALPSTAVPADAASAAAGWAGRQLTGGTHVESPFGPDFGLTADLVLALSAVGAGKGESAAATDWLAANASSYITGDTPGDVSAGSAAKLALVAETQHRDPAAFGQLDLLATLAGRLQPNGRYTDHFTFGGEEVSDYSNTFSQSLALLALERRGAQAVPQPAVDFLLASQCADGGFPVAFPDRPANCGSDADGTGIVAQALLAVGRKAEAEKALGWLESRQAPDGGFGGSGPTAASNTNSTALATQALRAGGHAGAADKGAAWLLAQQIGCTGKAEDRGAIGYQKPLVDGATLRATAQAIPALAGVPLAAVDGAGAAIGLPTLGCAAPSPSPTATATASATATATATASATATATATASASATASATPTAGPSAPATATTAPGTPTPGVPTVTGTPVPSATTSRPAPRGLSVGNGGAGGAGDLGGTGYSGTDYAVTATGISGPLASTGSSPLPVAAAATALLLAGGACAGYARRRRTQGSER
ncbi:prenyltransferase/squalene oxidase repeat-containing protein [Kitasatospora sp. NPDC050543]|uniref:prenyltransferase/squalene oxidase repeat-containing protein n=1 Tax=Kitasatospora sp. NPDC050543 TaxID=3364054 RepID=UPI0037B5E379